MKVKEKIKNQRKYFLSLPVGNSPNHMERKNLSKMYISPIGRWRTSQSGARGAWGTKKLINQDGNDRSPRLKISPTIYLEKRSKG